MDQASIPIVFFVSVKCVCGNIIIADLCFRLRSSSSEAQVWARMILCLFSVYGLHDVTLYKGMLNISLLFSRGCGLSIACFCYF